MNDIYTRLVAYSTSSASTITNEKLLFAGSPFSSFTLIWIIPSRFRDVSPSAPALLEAAEVPERSNQNVRGH